MISTKSGKLNHSRKFEKMRLRKFLKRLQNKCNPLCINGDGKSRSFMNFGLILICSPTNPSLLGLNVGGGAEVKLRLRRPNNELDFLLYCHNEYGPLNSDFYNLLDEIRKECEELMAKGITGTGQGFDLPGKRLGGFSRQAPLSSLRQSALAAAENRMKRKSLLPSGPKHIGRDCSIKVALSPIQAAAIGYRKKNA